MACVLLFLVGCGPAPNDSQEHQPSGYQLPQKAPQLHYAKHLRMAIAGDSLQVQVLKPFAEGRDTLRFAFAESELPLKRCLLISTTHAAFFQALGKTKAIRGFSKKAYLYDSSLRHQMASGAIETLGPVGGLSNEQVLAKQPDALFLSGLERETFQKFRKVGQRGIRVLPTPEWLENHPLGRLEWIQLFGLLVGAPKRADSLFRAEVAHYRQEKAQIPARKGPLVVTGSPWGDTWYMPSGQNYLARLIAEAGGRYVFAHDSSEGSIPLSFEQAYQKAAEADIWLNAGKAQTLQDLASIDPRLTDLPAARNGHAYSPTKRSRPDGANDYYEGALLKPHRVLRDLRQIFYQDSLSAESLYFYVPINPETAP